MSKSKRHTQIKMWGIKILMIFCFSISAIALSNGALYLQKVIFFKEFNSEDSYENTGDVEDTVEPGRLIGKLKHGDFGKIKKSNKIINIKEEKNLLSSIISFLSNSWVIIICYIICTGIFAYFLYIYVRKPSHKKGAQLNEFQTNHHGIKKTKKEKTIQKSINPLPTDLVRIKLIEWERSLPYYEKRRSYESIQQWLKRICRTGEIIPIYELIRYGNKSSSELDVEKTTQWIQQNSKNK